MRTVTLDLSNAMAVEKIGDDFRMRWEFCLHLSFVFKKTTGFGMLNDTSRFGQHTASVSAKNAIILAKILDRMMDDENSRIGMTYWGDDDGHMLDDFREFLRGGDFTIEDHTRSI